MSQKALKQPGFLLFPTQIKAEYRDVFPVIFLTNFGLFMLNYDLFLTISGTALYGGNGPNYRKYSSPATAAS